MKASKATAIAPQRVNVPLWAGVGAIVIGVVFMLTREKKANRNGDGPAIPFSTKSPRS